MESGLSLWYDGTGMDVRALWITGLPGSGKSTLSAALRERYPDFIVIRMDDLRRVVTPEPTYSESERDIVYRCLVFTARILVEHGHRVIIDATGNFRKWRELARTLIPGFREIYLKCPLDVCIRRERERPERYGAPEEVYRKGGEGWPVPGVSAPYEEPVSPDVLIETDRVSIAEAVKAVEDLFGRPGGPS